MNTPPLTHQPPTPTPPPAAPAPPADRRSDGLALAILAAGVFLAALDQTVVVTVLYKVQQDYNIPATQFDQLAWVVTAYLLGYTVTLPLMGRVADVWGRKWVFLGCLGVFMAGSVLAALSPSVEALIAARVVQAVGGGALLPVGIAMTRALAARGGRTFALGLLGAAAEAGSVMGPLWGALIIWGLTDWRAIFWLNLPLGVGIAAAVLLLPAQPRLRERIDWPGAVLLSGGLLALALGLSSSSSTQALAGIVPGDQAQAATQSPWQAPALLLGALVLLVAFIWWERRTAAPLVPLRLFARPAFSLANTTNFFVGAALIVAMVDVPLLVDSVRDGTAVDGAVMLGRLTLLIPVGALLGGALADRVGDRLLTVLGLLCCAVGFFLMSRWALAEPEAGMTAHLALTGFGFGLIIAPITATALHWVRAGQAGLAAALVNTARMIGALVGLSVLSAWGLELFKNLMAPYKATDYIDKPDAYEALVKAAGLQVYTAGFLVAAVICAVAILPALGLRRPAPAQAAAQEGAASPDEDA
jgi:MFS family permease